MVVNLKTIPYPLVFSQKNVPIRAVVNGKKSLLTVVVTWKDASIRKSIHGNNLLLQECSVGGLPFFHLWSTENLLE